MGISPLGINNLNAALNKAQNAAGSLQTVLQQSGATPDLTRLVTAAEALAALTWRTCKESIDPLVVSVQPLAAAQAAAADAQAAAAAASPLAS
jgi:type IV secretory pathway TrbF-like protein